MSKTKNIIKKILYILIISISIINTFLLSGCTLGKNNDLYRSLNYYVQILPYDILPRGSQVSIIEDDYDRLLFYGVGYTYLLIDEDDQAIKRYYAGLIYIVQKMDKNNFYVIKDVYFEYFREVYNPFRFKPDLENEKYKDFLEQNYWNIDPSLVPKNEIKTLSINIPPLYLDISYTKLEILAKQAFLDIFNLESEEKGYVITKYSDLGIISDNYSRRIFGIHLHNEKGNDKLYALCLQNISTEGDYTYLEDYAIMEIRFDHYQEDLNTFMEANNWNIPK